MRLSVWNHNASLGLRSQKNRELGSFLFGPVQRPLPMEQGRLDDREQWWTVRLRRMLCARKFLIPSNDLGLVA